MVQTDNQYRTSDTSLASFLITEHFFLLSIDYSQPRYEWILKDSEQLRESANNYIIGNAITDPAKYSRVFRKANRVLRKQVQWGED